MNCCSDERSSLSWLRTMARWFVLLAVAISFIEAKEDPADIDETMLHNLTRQSFPDLISDDIYMDPCKAEIFEGDIALTPQDVQRIKSRKKPRELHRITGIRPTHKNGSLEDSILHGRQMNAGGPNSGRRRKARAATALKERIWPEGVVPYDMEPFFSNWHKTLFKQAMRYWENATCIQFIEREPHHKSYIMFTQRSCGCCSFVGRRGHGGQAISIGLNCDKFGIVVHELGHVIGFWHEHTRPDRDDHIEILTENIAPGQEYNFNKMSEDEVNSLGMPYDYGSIMHYARNTFSKSMNLDTIIPKGIIVFIHPFIGQRVKLSPGDILQAKKLYKCAGCGFTVLEQSGRVDSPHQTVVGQFCQWRIIAAHGERITLNITYMRIYNTENCTNDYVEINDGQWSRSPVLGRFCSTSNDTHTFVSTGSRMLVSYKTKTRHPIYIGFEANYKMHCGGDVQKDHGILQSPNYPNEYPPKKECIWKIKVSGGQPMALSFLTFDLEKSKNCTSDFLEVRDGSDLTSPLLGRFCGNSLPKNVISSNDSLLVRFVTDGNVQKFGFSASFVKEKDECNTTSHGCEQICVNNIGSYTCECNEGFELVSDGFACETECGGLVTNPTGYVQSPSYPHLYPPNKNCTWEIVVPEGGTCTVNFTHFDVEGFWRNGKCKYDGVEITGMAANGTETYYGSFCGSRRPPQIISHDILLKIEFRSDATLQKSGFEFLYISDKDECQENNGGCQHYCRNTLGSYRCSCYGGYVLHSNQHDCKEGDCVQHINSSTGVIFSPSYPEFYPSRKECVWEFNITLGQRVKFKFDDFAIEPHLECTYDYLAMYDGINIHAPFLGRYCGLRYPRPILASTNQFLMIFHSDPSVQGKGFKLTYSPVCGSPITVTEVESVLYSHAFYGQFNYENKLDCQWFINSANHGNIHVRFDKMRIEKGDDCNYDSVSIYDGFEEDSPQLGKFCGSELPPNVTSTGPEMFINFKTDDSIGNIGFVLVFREVT